MSARLDCPANAFERYGLELIEESVPADPAAREAPVLRRRTLRPLDWGLLACFAALQIAHLAGLALFASWALRRLIGV